MFTIGQMAPAIEAILDRRVGSDLLLYDKPRRQRRRGNANEDR
jgi:hypothetical protein